MSTQQISKYIESLIQNALSDDHEYPKTFNEIKSGLATGEKEYSDAFVNSCKKIIFGKNNSAKAKVIAFQLIRDAMALQKIKVLQSVANLLLDDLFDLLCQSDKSTLSLEAHGKSIFASMIKNPNSKDSVDFLTMVLDSIRTWSSKYGIDKHQKETKFRKVFDNLQKNGVKFPGNNSTSPQVQSNSSSSANLLQVLENARKQFFSQLKVSTSAAKIKSVAEEYLKLYGKCLDEEDSFKTTHPKLVSKFTEETERAGQISQFYDDFDNNKMSFEDFKQAAELFCPEEFETPGYGHSTLTPEMFPDSSLDKKNKNSNIGNSYREETKEELNAHHVSNHLSRKKSFSSDEEDFDKKVHNLYESKLEPIENHSNIIKNKQNSDISSSKLPENNILASKHNSKVSISNISPTKESGIPSKSSFSPTSKISPRNEISTESKILSTNKISTESKILSTNKIASESKILSPNKTSQAKQSSIQTSQSAQNSQKKSGGGFDALFKNQASGIVNPGNKNSRPGSQINQRAPAKIMISTHQDSHGISKNGSEIKPTYAVSELIVPKTMQESTLQNKPTIPSSSIQSTIQPIQSSNLTTNFDVGKSSNHLGSSSYGSSISSQKPLAQSNHNESTQIDSPQKNESNASFRLSNSRSSSIESTFGKSKYNPPMQSIMELPGEGKENSMNSQKNYFQSSNIITHEKSSINFSNHSLAPKSSSIHSSTYPELLPLTPKEPVQNTHPKQSNISVVGFVEAQNNFSSAVPAQNNDNLLSKYESEEVDRLKRERDFWLNECHKLKSDLNTSFSSKTYSSNNEMSPLPKHYFNIENHLEKVNRIVSNSPRNKNDILLTPQRINKNPILETRYTETLYNGANKHYPLHEGLRENRFAENNHTQREINYSYNLPLGIEKSYKRIARDYYSGIGYAPLDSDLLATNNFITYSKPLSSNLNYLPSDIGNHNSNFRNPFTRSLHENSGSYSSPYKNKFQSYNHHTDISELNKFEPVSAFQSFTRNSYDEYPRSQLLSTPYVRNSNIIKNEFMHDNFNLAKIDDNFLNEFNHQLAVALK